MIIAMQIMNKQTNRREEIHATYIQHLWNTYLQRYIKNLDFGSFMISRNVGVVQKLSMR